MYNLTLRGTFLLITVIAIKTEGNRAFLCLLFLASTLFLFSTLPALLFPVFSFLLLFDSSRSVCYTLFFLDNITTRTNKLLPADFPLKSFKRSRRIRSFNVQNTKISEEITILLYVRAQSPLSVASVSFFLFLSFSSFLSPCNLCANVQRFLSHCVSHSRKYRFDDRCRADSISFLCLFFTVIQRDISAR